MESKKKKYVLFKGENGSKKPCAFFALPDGCKNGSSCSFSHGSDLDIQPNTDRIQSHGDQSLLLTKTPINHTKRHNIQDKNISEFIFVPVNNDHKIKSQENKSPVSSDFGLQKKVSNLKKRAANLLQ